MNWEPLLFYSLLIACSWKILHNLFLWMESKGWIYYKTKPSGSGMGNALQELNSFMNPANREVLERKFEHKEEDHFGQGKPPYGTNKGEF